MGARFMGMLAGLLVVVFVVGALVLAVWGDDPLEPGARQALQLPERLPREINLFNPLSGFGIAEGKDPAEEGYAAVTRVNELLAAAGPGDDPALGEKVRRAWITPSLSVADDEGVLCSPKADGCLAQLWDRRDELIALAEAHQTLLRRHRTLAEFGDYRMELHPHVEMPLPELLLLTATHRLWLGMQAASYLHGESEGLRAVIENLRFLRRVLAQADDLLTKMVFASMLGESLHVYAALMDRAVDGKLDALSEIEPLSTEEASLESASVSEFRFINSALLTIENNPKVYENLGLPRWLGTIALRPLFKPNRSVNSAYRCWRKTHEATRLMLADALAPGVSKKEINCKFGWTDWISNPVGTILVSTGQPDFGRYATRLQDLRGLINLVNLKRSIRRAGITEDNLADYLSAEGAGFPDPYTGQPMSWNSETRTLYFTSPLPHRGYHRLPLNPLG